MTTEQDQICFLLLPLKKNMALKHRSLLILLWDMGCIYIKLQIFLSLPPSLKIVIITVLLTGAAMAELIFIQFT